MTIFGTGQLYHVAENNIRLVLDITVKSGEGIGKLFAPTWSMVMASKKGEITWDEYTEMYYHYLRTRYKRNKTFFHQLFTHEEFSQKFVILACYCQDTHSSTQHCHRYLAIEILEKIAAKNGFEFTYEGEV